MKLKVLLFFVFLLVWIPPVVADDLESLLPAPTGRYKIATTKLFLVDSTRKETFVLGGKPRELYVKLWYPVASAEAANYDHFLGDFPSEVISGIFHDVGLDRELVGQVQKTITHSYSGAHTLYAEEAFPVVIFNPGFYFGMADFYTSIVENLASHGFVVCTLNHPFEQPYVEQTIRKSARLKRKKAQLAYLQLFLIEKFKRFDLETEEQVEAATRYNLRKLKRFDRVIRRWTLDNEVLIDYLKAVGGQADAPGILSQIDPQRLGVFGHSMGGAVAGQVSLQNPDRVKAGANLDCFQFGDLIDHPLEQPFMLMESEHYHLWNLGNSVVYSQVSAPFHKLTIKGARHFAFSDVSMLDLIEEKDKKKMIGDIDGAETLRLINAYLEDFFSHYLKDGAAVRIFDNFEDQQIKYKNILP
ncbi:alpha/beta hydrolase family protein [Geofilum rhodophaeum]|uniref:alpha/beta hydrolase family protein n=1 Tax=Geofilum rhodophaeum TaxID=1965019 RepID=UPI0013149418|nr:hypothetical protein [Geofilum rhodophaeum]